MRWARSRAGEPGLPIPDTGPQTKRKALGAIGPNTLEPFGSGLMVLHPRDAPVRILPMDGWLRGRGQGPGLEALPRGRAGCSGSKGMTMGQCLYKPLAGASDGQGSCLGSSQLRSTSPWAPAACVCRENKRPRRNSPGNETVCPAPPGRDGWGTAWLPRAETTEAAGKKCPLPRDCRPAQAGGVGDGAQLAGDRSPATGTSPAWLMLEIPAVARLRVPAARGHPAALRHPGSGVRGPTLPYHIPGGWGGQHSLRD